MDAIELRNDIDNFINGDNDKNDLKEYYEMIVSKYSDVVDEICEYGSFSILEKLYYFYFPED